jgi:hypothetical protein
MKNQKKELPRVTEKNVKMDLNLTGKKAKVNPNCGLRRPKHFCVRDVQSGGGGSLRHQPKLEDHPPDDSTSICRYKRHTY